MYRPEIKVLDCTIRDGGLINDHQFTDKFVQNVFKAVSAAGVDYMEIGYKADSKLFSADEFGKWKFCEEAHLEEILGEKPENLKLSAMVDIGRIDLNDIAPAADSMLDMLRVACYIKDIDKAIDMVNHINDKGYETTINIMAVSHAKDAEIDEALHQVANECKPLSVYVVDSFGAMYSEPIRHLVSKYKRILNPKGIEIGFHGHNNQQLAFANTIETIIEGGNFLDATISGIGRGAGNCPLELLLGFLKNPKFDIKPILEVLQNAFIPLREEIEWGAMVPYNLTGMLNEHPRSAMKLRAGEDKDQYVKFYETLLEDTHL